MAHEEYLRRNLVHASSVGAVAGVKTIIGRLEGMKTKPPKWLMASLAGVQERAERSRPELARWRNAADDAPDYVARGG